MLSLDTGIKGLKSTVRGLVLTPGDDGYDAERAAWSLLVDHHPAIIVVPINAEDVAAAVRFAAAEGLPVAVQATGHGATVPADGVLLINTRRLTSVEIDPSRSTARIQAGAKWGPVIELAARRGLAPLVGSSPGVGAVGYLTGGGLPVLGRRYGFSVDYVRAIDLVTADGLLRHVTAQDDPDLFWAVRGGKGNFGVVTALEMELLPITRLYGGALTFPLTEARRVLNTWLGWVAEQREEMSSSIAFLRIPNLDLVPEAMRGHRSLNVRIAFTGSEEEGARLIQPLRDLGPEMDTVAEMPYRELGKIHGDPEQPTPVIDSGTLLSELDGSAVERIVSLIGPDADLPPGMIEIRRLGGALNRPAEPANAIGNRSGAFSLLVAFVVLPGEADRAAQSLREVTEGMRPWDTGASLPNQLGSAKAEPHQVRTAYREEDYVRLTAIKTKYDPKNMFQINQNIPPAPTM
jgi:FAD/FMN-containing dehydrogenase